MRLHVSVLAAVAFFVSTSPIMAQPAAFQFIESHASVGLSEGGPFRSVNGFESASATFSTDEVAEGTPNYGSATASAFVDPVDGTIHLFARAQRDADGSYGDDLFGQASIGWTEEFTVSIFEPVADELQARVNFRLEGSVTGLAHFKFDVGHSSMRIISSGAQVSGDDFTHVGLSEPPGGPGVNEVHDPALYDDVLANGGSILLTAKVPTLPVGAVVRVMSLDFSASVFASTEEFRSAAADFGNTLTITGIELVDLQGNSIPIAGYTTASGLTYPIAVVPEPSSFGLVGVGLFAVAARRRRRLTSGCFGSVAHASVGGSAARRKARSPMARG